MRHLAGFDVINRDVASSVKMILEVLEKSVANELSVEIDYRTGAGEQSRTRIIDPYGILYWYSSWYMVGFCHLRNEIRSFRVERIMQLKQTSMTFQRPEDFSAREYFLTNIKLDSELKNTGTQMIIRGKPGILDDLCNHWFLGYHLTQRTNDQANFLLDKEVIRKYVPYFLLSYGKDIHIVEPQSLRSELISVASELIEYYKT